jgi:hypothetical protein
MSVSGGEKRKSWRDKDGDGDAEKVKSFER